MYKQHHPKAEIVRLYVKKEGRSYNSTKGCTRMKAIG
jgi:hypothetical protein